MSGVRHIKVAEDDHGQRLDRWLKKAVPELPYGLAQKMMRKGAIRIDGKRAKPDTRLESGQKVRIPPLEDKPKDGKRKLTDKDIAYIKSLVIFDDGDVMAINKPQGLATQGGTKIKRHVDGFLDGLVNKKGVRPRLVHRLDKDTSGVLLLARSAEAARGLGRIFKSRDARKIYWALVAPSPAMPEGTINAPLAKMGGVAREKMNVDEEAGKKAVTEYKVLEQAHDRAAFIAFWPRTGRMHQIRIHAALMETPVIGDRKYGAQAERIEGVSLHNGLHLHARRMICPHPTKKGMIDVTAPLPPELAKSWKALGFSTNDKEDPFAELMT